MISLPTLDVDSYVRFIVSSMTNNKSNRAVDVDWQSNGMPPNAVDVLSKCDSGVSISDIQCVIDMANTMTDISSTMMYKNSDGDPVLCIMIDDKSVAVGVYDELLDSMPDHILDSNLIIIVS